MMCRVWLPCLWDDGRPGLMFIREMEIPFMPFAGLRLVLDDKHRFGDADPDWYFEELPEMTVEYVTWLERLGATVNVHCEECSLGAYSLEKNRMLFEWAKRVGFRCPSPGSSELA